MLLLTQHVFAHLLQCRSAHGKDPVSFLPCESRPLQLRLDPFRRLGLWRTDEIRNRIGRFQSDKVMGMVVSPANRVWRAAGMTDHLSEICVEPLAEIRWKPCLPVLGGEHDVENQGAMRRWHNSTFLAALRDARKFTTFVPGVAPPATFVAPLRGLWMIC